MNLLYISSIVGNKYSGLTSAISNHVDAQSKYDSVFWYNLVELKTDIYTENVECHTVKDYPNGTITSLPAPFNHPQLVIFEDIYYISFLKIAKQCKQLNIPYIVVPHCCLCSLAQKRKRIKKCIGNILLFSRFIKKAAAIHFLTEKEYLDSGKKWNANHFVIPNGITMPQIQNQKRVESELVGTFIGRLDIFQKGIDLLINAATLAKTLLKQNNLHINIYGADSVGDKNRIIAMIKNNQLEDFVSIYNPVFDDDKKQVLLNSDFFILTSRFEGHPMGLIEALAYGLPSLVTDGTNMGEEIASYNAGWVCKCTPESISEGLKTIVEERHRMHDLQINAKELAKQYSWDKIAQSAHENYQRIISGERICEQWKMF